VKPCGTKNEHPRDKIGSCRGVDGNVLLRACTSSNASDQSYCQGYLRGATDMFTIWRIGIGKSHCPPSAVNSEQVRDVVVNYLRDKPARRHIAASLLIVEILASTWCPAVPDAPTVDSK
jgi:hypothetical protein